MHYAADWRSFPNASDATDSQLKKFVHIWTPDESTGQPAGTIAILHGLGEHGGRYHGLARKLTAAGFQVAAFDQQGHGKDPGPRGFVASYESLIADVSAFLDWIQTQLGTQTVLLGHSMGGNLALNHALRIGQGYCGVVASSPMIRAQRAPGRIVESLLRMWIRLMPSASMTSTVIAERLMSDPDEIASFKEDDLFHSTLSLRLGAGLIDSGRWALTNAGDLSVPLLLSHGDTDELTRTDASEEFASRSNENCELRIWKGFLHDPFRCEGGQEVVDCFVDFAKRQLAAESTPESNHQP